GQGDDGSLLQNNDGENGEGYSGASDRRLTGPALSGACMQGKTIRTIELWCGLVAGVLGIVVPIYGLATNSSLSSELGSAILVIFGLALSAATGAALDSQSTNAQAAASGIGFLLSGALPLVLVAVVLTAFSPGNLGIYVLPAALLALTSAVAGTYSDLANGRAVQPAVVSSLVKTPLDQEGLVTTTSSDHSGR